MQYLCLVLAGKTFNYVCTVHPHNRVDLFANWLLTVAQGFLAHNALYRPAKADLQNLYRAYLELCTHLV